MTYAWYGHLKNPNLKLGQAVLISWGVAFFEYCFMVPANRIGYKTFNAYQLKIIQEVITLSVFVVFAYFFLVILLFNYFKQLVVNNHHIHSAGISTDADVL